MATVSGGTASEKFGFIERFQKELGVRYLCQWFKVSQSGFYAWRKREESQRSKEDRKLLVSIRRAFEKSRGTYGSPRVHEALKREEIYVGRKRVERIMREARLKARAIKHYRRMPGLHKYFNSIKNKRLNLSKPSGINQIWVADITFLKVKKCWHYLATVMDLYSRKIISWS